MKRAYGTKTSVEFFFCVCTIGHRLLRRFPRNHGCQGPFIFPIFFWVEPLVCASAGATSPLYGIVRRLLGWNSRVCRGYEVDIFFCFALLIHVVLLLCFCLSLVPMDLFGGCRTQWRPPVVLPPCPTTISFFSTPRSIFRTLVLFREAKFVFLELHHTAPVSRIVRIRSHPIGVAVAYSATAPGRIGLSEYAGYKKSKNFKNMCSLGISPTFHDFINLACA